MTGTKRKAQGSWVADGKTSKRKVLQVVFDMGTATAEDIMASGKLPGLKYGALAMHLKRLYSASLLLREEKIREGYRIWSYWVSNQGLKRLEYWKKQRL